MDKKYLLGMIAFAMVAMLGISFAAAFPFGKGVLNQNISDADKQAMKDNRQAIQTAIENNDFESWKGLMSDRIEKMKDQLTEEGFNQLVQVHEKMSELKQATEEAKQTGDYSKVQELKKELGIEGRHFVKKQFKNMNVSISD